MNFTQYFDTKKNVKILLLILSVSFFYTFLFSSNLNFDNKNASIVINSTNSRLRLKNINKVVGWSEQSIIKNNSYNSAGAWKEAYASGVVIGSGGIVPATDLLITTSNAVNLGTGGGDTILMRTTSNAVNYLGPIIRTNSNTLNYNMPILRTTSNGVNQLRLRFDSLYGPHEIINTSPYQLTKDLYLDSTNILTVSVSGEIDGGGHSIYFARGQANVFSINNGVSTILKNVVLRDFDDTAIQLTGSASITFGDGSIIELADSSRLNRHWTFAGDSKIIGFGNKLNFSYFNLGILQPGTLTLRDIIIDNLKHNNMRCVGGNASIVLNDCQLIMANNFSFTTGTLQFEHEVKITGSNVLSYESVGQSIINSQSRLFLDMGVTFSYAPSVAQKNLLAFTDATSQLYCNGCTLKTTTTGMQLAKGTLIVDHKNTFYNDNAASLSEALIIGNGVSSDDLTVEVKPGGSLEMLTGIMVYANTQ